MTSLINDILSLPLWFSIPLGVIYLALLAYFFHILWHYRRKNALALLLTIVALASGQSAWAAEKTVTYTFIADHAQYNVSRWTLTFTPSSTGFGYSTGEKTATIENISSTTGFTVNLDDGLQLTYKQDQGHMTFWGSNGFYLNGTNDGGNSKLTLTSSHYYVTHVKLANTSGSALTGQASPWMTGSDYLDQDVDMVTQYGDPQGYREFSANFPYAQVFGQLTVTYGDPREYAITFNDAVNGQNGVTNPNPTSYSVTTNTFDITAPTRTGYTLSGTTYTDSQHPNATAVNLNMTPLSIYRGEAVQRKAITLNASWTAHQYTVHYDANGGEGSMDDQTLTYDEGALAANAFTAPTDYVFNGWNTEDDGSGTAYTDQQAAPNVSPDDGATVTLYAQWRPVAGSCGDNARWSYDDNGTLSITGTGGTDDYMILYRPWEQYKDAITTVSIGDGITYIGESAFDQCSNLANITGGNGLINVNPAAFLNTQWLNARKDNNIVNYIGRVAYLCGNGVSGDVTLADGTISITMFAFAGISAITSVTIPASVATIYPFAFYDCHALTTVHVLADTPPMLGGEAFSLQNSSLTRTFNVRSAAYKTADGWADIYNKEDEYSYNDFQMRVVSTLALPDGISIVPETSASPVTILGADYYVEGANITLSGCSTDVIDHGSFTAGTRYAVGYNDGEARTDRYTPDADGQATFTMPAADAVVSTEEYGYAVKYIDADGEEKTCTDFTVVGSDYEFGDYYGTATLGVTDYNEHWYVVVGTVSLDMPLSFRGIARLILCDGAALRINASDNSYAFHILDAPLSIYGQTQGTGTLSVTNTGNGINVNHGITINGGTVIATGKYSNGIDINQGGTLTINHGTVTASGRSGIYIDQATLTQNGGTLNAIGSGSSGIYALNNAAVTLGWTNAADRITASSYYTEDDATISVKSGQTLYDGTTAYSGTLDADQLGSLAGKTLLGVDVLLDDDSAQPSDSKNADRIAALADGKQHNIMLQGRRLWKDGDWNTLCLPFAVSDFTGTPLEDATVKELNGSSSNLTDGTLTLNFSNDLNAIEAGKPYIVEWVSGENITNPVFSGVTVKSGLNNTAFTDGQFVGTYSPVAWPEENRSILFLGEKNTLYYPQAGAHVNAFRAYFELSNANGVREFVMNFDEDSSETTIISPAEIKEIAERADAAWYTLDGRKLNAKPTKKGLYIYKGKKVKKS